LLERDKNVRQRRKSQKKLGTQFELSLFCSSGEKKGRIRSGGIGSVMTNLKHQKELGKKEVCANHGGNPEKD